MTEITMLRILMITLAWLLMGFSCVARDCDNQEVQEALLELMNERALNVNLKMKFAFRDHALVSSAKSFSYCVATLNSSMESYDFAGKFGDITGQFVIFYKIETEGNDQKILIMKHLK